MCDNSAHICVVHAIKSKKTVILRARMTVYAESSHKKTKTIYKVFCECIGRKAECRFSQW